MSDKHVLILNRHNRALAKRGIDAADDGWALELRPSTRTDRQNDALHGLIEQILQQRPTHEGVRMSKEDYKLIFMNALSSEMKMLPTLDGDGYFPVGQRTSRLSTKRFNNLMEIIFAWCAREGIEVKHFDDADLAA